MDPVEQPLLLALEAAPDDWGLRLMIAEKQVQRGAVEEASELVSSAPKPPASDGDLQKLAEIGGPAAIPLVEKFAVENPTNPYGHTILAHLWETAGNEEKAQTHYTVANALSGVATPETSVPEQTEIAPPPSVAVSSIEPPLITVAATTAESGSEPGLISTSPKEARIEPMVKPKSRNGSKTTAILVAVAIHAAIILIATLLVILPPSKDEPEIVALMAPAQTTAKQEMKKKTVQKMVKRSPSSSSSAAAPMAIMMRANAVASFSAPVTTKTSTGPMGMGEGDLGSGGFGIGTGLGSGSGGGATFFGGKATGKRFLFIIDHSASMNDEQVELRNNELERSLSTLKGVQYHVVLFAGPAFFAEKGWEAVNANRIIGPEKTYSFITKAVDDFEFSGPPSALPRAKWRNATPENTKETMDYIRETDLIAGTDWEIAFRVGHYMEPPPDVIFFMSDGGGGNDPSPILATNAKRGSPVINTVSMQTKVGAAQFSAVAKGTGGKFTVVDKEGKAIDGDDYLRNPEKYADRLQ